MISDDLVAAVSWANFKQNAGSNRQNACLFIEDREMAFILYLFGVFSEERAATIIGKKPTDLSRLSDLATEISPLTNPNVKLPLSPYSQTLVNVSNKILRLSNLLRNTSTQQN